MSIGLHILLIYSIICFLKASLILKMKVVPNDNLKFGGERVKVTIGRVIMTNLTGQF